MNKKKVLPYCYLVLYAKGWIRFPWIKYERNSEEYYYKVLKTLLKMCGFSYLTNNDVLNHVMMATDKLRELFQKENVEFNYMIDSFHSMILGAKDYQRNYQIESFELALIRYCLSAFSMLDIRHFAVKYIPYKKFKIKTMTAHVSSTYTHSQKIFDKTFKDLLINSQSCDVDAWWMRKI